MKSNKIMLILLVIMMSLSGCGDNTNNSSQTTETIASATTETTTQLANDTPKTGGTLTIAARNPRTLNPLLNEDETVDQVLSLIYEKLVIFDDTMKPQSNIASSWSISEDGLSLTVKLNQGIMWHSGDELSAKDVVFSLDTIKKSQDTSAYKACVKNILSYSAQDDYTVQIVYRQFFSGYAYALNFPIICEKQFNGEDVLTSGKNMSPIGTGAYEFESFTSMDRLSLSRNKDWFKGSSYIDNINVEIMPEKTAELYAFEQKKINIISTDIVDWAKYGNDKENTIYEFTTNYYDFIGVNFNNELLKLKDVRQAIAYAISKEAIVEDIYLNHAVVTDIPINPNSWLNTLDEITYSYKPEKSKERLQQQGFTDTNADGIIEKAGINIELSLLVNSENVQRVKIAEMIKNYLKEVGIIVNIEAISYDMYVQRLANKEFDMFLGGWELSVIPDYTFAFHSSQISDGSNFISYNDTEMDNILQRAFLAKTDEELLSEYRKLNNFILKELPYISLYFRNSCVITDSTLKGTSTPDFLEIYDGIENMFVAY